MWARRTVGLEMFLVLSFLYPSKLPLFTEFFDTRYLWRGTVELGVDPKFGF